VTWRFQVPSTFEQRKLNIWNYIYISKAIRAFQAVERIILSVTVYLTALILRSVPNEKCKASTYNIISNFSLIIQKSHQFFSQRLFQLSDCAIEETLLYFLISFVFTSKKITKFLMISNLYKDAYSPFLFLLLFSYCDHLYCKTHGIWWMNHRKKIFVILKGCDAWLHTKIKCVVW
jgi:hypothetical protein